MDIDIIGLLTTLVFIFFFLLVPLWEIINGRAR